MSELHAAALVAVIALVTAGLRFAPFVLIRGKQTPKFLDYLGKVLPFSIMGMLVVYCLRNTALLSAPHGIPEAISVVLVAALHLWKRNTLLSILSGTVCYMLLVQLVF